MTVYLHCIEATVGGRLDHEELTLRLDALEGLHVRQAGLTRELARRGRRLVVPEFTGRYIVQTEDPNHFERTGDSGPYRGANGDALGELLNPRGARVNPVSRGTLTLQTTSPDEAGLQPLVDELDDLQWRLEVRFAVEEDDLGSFTRHILHARVVGPPDQLIPVMDRLHAAHHTVGWRFRVQWHTEG